MNSAHTRSQGRLARTARLGLGLAALAVAVAWAQPGQAQAATTCTWAGTAVEPTGWFTVSPGMTNLPAAGPSKFVASGEMDGSDPRCQGQMKFVGQIDAGSTCAVASFEGAVKGLDGVARFWGKGSLLVPSFLYDKAGNVVGVENANILTEHNQALTADCFSPGGFTGPADFSSTFVLF